MSYLRGADRDWVSTTDLTVEKVFGLRPIYWDASSCAELWRHSVPSRKNSIGKGPESGRSSAILEGQNEAQRVQSRVLSRLILENTLVSRKILEHFWCSWYSSYMQHSLHSHTALLSSCNCSHVELQDLKFRLPRSHTKWVTEPWFEPGKSASRPCTLNWNTTQYSHCEPTWINEWGHD